MPRSADRLFGWAQSWRDGVGVAVAIVGAGVGARRGRRRGGGVVGAGVFCGAPHRGVDGYRVDGCSVRSVSSAWVNAVAHGQFVGSRDVGFPARFTTRPEIVRTSGQVKVASLTVEVFQLAGMTAIQSASRFCVRNRSAEPSYRVAPTAPAPADASGCHAFSIGIAMKYSTGSSGSSEPAKSGTGMYP